VKRISRNITGNKRSHPPLLSIRIDSVLVLFLCFSKSNLEENGDISRLLEEYGEGVERGAPTTLK